MQDVGSPPATWLTADAWNNICFLDAKIPCLQGLKESIEKDAGWYKWQASEAPEQEAYPGGMLTNTVPSLAQIFVWFLDSVLCFLNCPQPA